MYHKLHQTSITSLHNASWQWLHLEFLAYKGCEKCGDNFKTILMALKWVSNFKLIPDVSIYPAIANLNGVTLYGKKIHVTLSKHSTVQMPQAGSNVSFAHVPMLLQSN